MAGMFRLWLLLIAALMSTSASLSTDRLDQLVDRMELLNYPGQTCDLLVWQSRTLTAMEWYHRQDSRVRIHVSDRSASQENLVASFIAESCSCILQIIDHENINKAEKYLTKKADSSTIVLISISKLADVMIQPHRPVFLVSLEHNRWLGLVRVCPDKSLQLIPATSYALKQEDTVCKHFLHGKMINVSYYDYRKSLIRTTLTGIHVELLNIVAEKLGFHPMFVSSKPGFFIKKQGRFSSGSTVDKVFLGHSLFGIGRESISFFRSMSVDFVTPLFSLDTVWVTRHPKKVPSYESLQKVFPPLVWMLVLISSIAVSATFGMIYFVYRTMLPEQNLARQVDQKIDFVLKPFAQFFEPMVIKWFLKWSSGKALCLMWAFACMTLAFIYVCNLRAHLLAGSSEAPIDSTEDVIRRGRKVYVPDNVKPAIDNNQSEKYDRNRALVRLIEAHGGFYDVTRAAQIMPQARDDALASGAVYLSAWIPFLYEYQKNKSHGLPNLSYSKEPAFPYVYSTIILPKHVPWSRSVKSVFQWLHDTGVIMHVLYSPVSIEARREPKMDILKDEEKPLSADTFGSLFLLGGTALLLATIALFVEVLTIYKKQHCPTRVMEESE